LILIKQGNSDNTSLPSDVVQIVLEESMADGGKYQIGHVVVK